MFDDTAKWWLVIAALVGFSRPCSELLAETPPNALQHESNASGLLDGGLRITQGSPWIEFRGRPILLVGDSITQGWMELGEDFDQQSYLDALARRGINALLLWSYIGIEGHLARFFNSGVVDFPRMHPTGRLSSTGICLADVGRQYVVFAQQGESPFTLDLSDTSRLPFAARWYDPHTGEWRSADAVPGGNVARLQAPLDGDAVLILQRSP